MKNPFEILFNKLEINDKQGLFKFSNIADWEYLLPYRSIRALKSIKPYAIYAIKNNNEAGSQFVPVYLFIDNSGNAEQVTSLHKLWNFQTPVVIIDNGNQWLWYSGKFLTEDKGLNELISPVDKSQIEENTETDHFSFWNIHSGSLWEKFENHFVEDSQKKQRRKLQTYLLQNIEEAIRILTKSNDKIQHKDNRQIANNLIGRLIFVRYLIDRNVKLNFKYIDDNNQRADFENVIQQKDKLYSLFEFLKSPDKFNGDLFPFHNNSIEEEKQLIKDNHLKILHELFLGEKIEEDKKQYSLASLFNIYDFNIIPVELISNIYERFIGKEQQKKGGAFYTPPFLVDYVLKHTIEPHLEKHTTCKVLDPSCGSGIFLVETLRKIIEKNIREGNLKKLDVLENEAKTKKNSLKTLIKKNDKKLIEIVENNIFGIDKDPNAVTIAIFSIYITILDYKEPREIENFKLPELIDNNFFIKNFFDTELDKIFEKFRLDFIIGNPPWGSVKDDPLHKDFVDKHKNKISRYQIAQSFSLRVQSFTSEYTKCALVLPSLLLYNNTKSAVNFRKHIIQNYEINRVLELSSVRKLVFEGGKQPATIIFFKIDAKKDHSKNIVHYISLKPNKFFNLFKIIAIEKLDYKKIYQEVFEKDFAWKAFLYGNILDYKFLDRVHEGEYTNLKQFVKDKKLVFGTGYVLSETNAEFDADVLLEKPLMNEKKLLPFYTTRSALKTFSETYPDIKKVDHTGYPEIYLNPHIIIRQGVNKRVIASLLDYDAVFPKALFGIHSQKDKKIITFLSSYFSSSFTSYLLFNIAPRWGVERDVIDKKNFEALPIPELKSGIVETINKKYKELIEQTKLEYEQVYNETLKEQEGFMSDYSNKEEFLKKVREVTTKRLVEENKFEGYFDDIIYKLFDVDNEEQSLIDYTLNVSVPLFRQKEKIKKRENPFRNVSKTEIENYINVFFEKNQSFLDWKGIFMTAEVYFDKRNYIIVNFKYETEKPTDKIVYPKHNERQDKFIFLSNLFALPENISDNLFMQKDLRGFEKTSFYVIKPNEFKNWHPAVAYLDYYEFKAALLKAGKANKHKMD